MLLAGVAVLGGHAGDGVTDAGSYPGGGGSAHVWRSSGLAFQGRNRSSAGPVSGFPPLRPHSSRYAVSHVRMFRQAIRAVAVTVQIPAAFRPVSPLPDPPAFFLVPTRPRTVLSPT